MTDAVGNFFDAIGREFSGEKRGRGLEKSTQPGGGQGPGTPTVKGSTDFSVGSFVTELGTAAATAGASAAVASLLAPTPKEKVAGPGSTEIQAQKETEELLTAQQRLQRRERESRQKVITARAAGPQTLFKREGEIPRAIRLGGGRRA